MSTVSGDSVLQDEELVNESNNEILDDGEDEETPLEDTESNQEDVVDVSGNSSGTTSLPSDEIPAVTFPEEITLSNEQFETLMSKQEELNQNVQINTCMNCLLLGVLIGMIFVRGIGKFVKGV